MDLKLKKLDNFEPRKGPVLLIVMDGVGFGKKDESDCVHLANTPTLDKLLQSKNQAVLKAHGTAVGLPTDDDMGNSEVGHLNLGLGRILYQDLPRINKEISNNNFYKNKQI